MLPKPEQWILGYFIDEAKDHLNTIEQGLLNLHDTLQDTEMVNEVLRAAHSLKGGAAMLGLDSIQQTAHHLEDYFEILKECPTVAVDQKLESLFLRVFNALKELIEHLEESVGLSEDVVNNIMLGVKPVFETLNQRLKLLIPQRTNINNSTSSNSLIEDISSISTTEESNFYNLFRDTEATQKNLDISEEFDHDYLKDINLEESEIYIRAETQSISDENPFDEWLDLEPSQPEAELETTSDFFIDLTNKNKETTDSLEDLVEADADLHEPNALFVDSEDFSDLEVLLAEASQQEIDTDEFFQLEELLNLDASGEVVNDEFADLEMLLEAPIITTPIDASPQETDVVNDEFADLEMLLEAPITTTPVTDEFSQLEALLDLDTLAASVTVEQPVVSSTAEKRTNRRSTVKPSNQTKAADLPRRAASEQTMRVPVKHLDNITNLIGELVVNRNSLEQEQQRMRQFLGNLLHQVQQLSDSGSRMQELYERSLMEASLLNIRQGSQTASLDPHATGMDFDALEMDRFTGFHTLSQEVIELIVRVREASSDIEFVTDETEQVARQFRQVTTQLQEGLTRSRMVPFSQIAERLPRAVRDIALKYGKQAQLNIEGGETLIDKVILEQLYDPMTHLVNNSITHGIETPEERSRKGKSEVGQINIQAFHQGNQTVISVADDGAGIDTEIVKAKAIKKGLISEHEAKNMSRLEVYNLLFHPGFSTKDSADEFAGRGVGMDVVKTSLSEIRGTINTDSSIGVGTTFTIRLPLTLSIGKALCCLSDKTQIAFPLDGVEDMIDVPITDVRSDEEGRPCILWRDALLQFRPLKELLVFNRQLERGNFYGGNREDDKTSIVVLRSAGTFLAVQVDQVLGEQEIVIKQFEGPVPKPVGVAGATVLGDGRIMPIADVLELIDLSMGRLQQKSSCLLIQTHNAAPVVSESPSVKTEPTVLIVDDSITVRELLSMTFINAGYRVEQARDGQEAWDKLRNGLPCDIVFCDIEMPRMDGLELLSHIQKEPSLNRLPIAMLTSRGADRHRKMAAQLGASGYFIKPYLEEALLDGAQRMLKGEVLITSSVSNVE